jgi:hypothetical protein
MQIFMGVLVQEEFSILIPKSRTRKKTLEKLWIWDGSSVCTLLGDVAEKGPNVILLHISLITTWGAQQNSQ